MPQIGVVKYITPFELIRNLWSALDEARKDVHDLNDLVETMELRHKYDTKCACILDRKDDVCLTHSPAVAKAIVERDSACAKLAKMKAEYTDLLARCDATQMMVTQVGRERDRATATLAWLLGEMRVLASYGNDTVEDLLVRVAERRASSV